MARKQAGYDNIDIGRNGITVYDSKSGMKEIANFGFALLHRITDRRDQVFWHAAIQPGKQADIYVTLQHDEFATAARFHAALLRKGFVWKGENGELNLLKEQLIPQCQHAEYISTLGQHPDTGAYLFHNGALLGKDFTRPNDFNMCEVADQTLFLSWLDGRADEDAARLRYVDAADRLSVNNWLKAMASAYGDVAALPVCFFLHSLFRDISYDVTHFDPLLYLFGEAGGGKSMIARSLTAAGGFPQAPYSLINANTVKSLPRRLAQVRNFVLWFDEYKNDLPDAVKGVVQSTYDGAGYYKATKETDTGTSSIRVLSSCVLTSNFLPSEQYLLERILLHDVPKISNRPAAQEQAFAALQEMESAGKCAITPDILQHRGAVAKAWKATYAKLQEELRQSGLSTRLINNMAVCLTPARILQEQGKINFKAAFPSFDWKAAGGESCVRQSYVLQGKSELMTFFEIFMTGVEAGALKAGEAWRLSKHKGALCLALLLPRVLSYYLPEHRKLYNKIGLPKIELEKMLRAHPACVTKEKDADVRFLSPTSGKAISYSAILLDYAASCKAFGVFLVDVWETAEQKTCRNLPTLDKKNKQPSQTQQHSTGGSVGSASVKSPKTSVKHR